MKLGWILSVALFSLSSCASGPVNWRERGYGGKDGDSRPARVVKRGKSAPRTTQKDIVRTRNSSYRVRGTDEVGSLTPRQHAVLRAKTRDWRWPLNSVALTSRFGFRSGEFHDGVDLRASTGTPVYSVAPGVVIYSGSKIRGYGKMVVVRHAGKLSTVYAHNSKLYVKPGQKIRRGQLIASSGNTGRSTGPHVHFEVREGVTAVNPVILMQTPAVHNEAYRRIAATEKDRVRTKASATSVRRSRVARAKPGKKESRPAARLATTDDGFNPKIRRDLEPRQSSRSRL